MWKWLWPLVAAFIVVIGCGDSREKTAPQLGTVSEAFTANSSVGWANYGSTCVCGGDYACSGYPGWGSRTFADPTPAGARVATSISVTANEVGCGVGAVDVQLNGVSLGTYTADNGCGCGQCTPRVVSFTNPAGIPGYLYGANNVLNLIPSVGYICVHSADMVITGPSFTGVAPAAGTAGGGTSVTLTGTDFQAGTPTVTFGGTAATGVVRVNATTITATTPVHAGGPVAVTIAWPGGATLTLPAGYAFSSVPSTTTLTSAVNPSVFGQAVVFTAHVANVGPAPTGNVVFRQNAIVLGTVALNGAGDAALSISSLAVGANPIIATYVGDATYQPSFSPALAQVVNQASTATAVVSSINPQTVGGAVTFTATVTAVAPGAGTPTGVATFWEGGTLLGSAALVAGKGSFVTSSLIVGVHPVNAVYGGDTNFAVSSSALLRQSIVPDDVGVGLGSAPNPSMFGVDVVFSVTVKTVSTGGVPTGTVTLYEGAAARGSGGLDGSGQASITVSGLAGGKHSITAVYAGDTNHNPGTSNIVTQTVMFTSTTTLGSSANPSVFGQSVTLTAHVATMGGIVPTGTITFREGAVVVGTVALNASGDATYTTSALSVGAHSFTATYPGDAIYTPGVSGVLAQQVTKANATTVLASSSNPQTVGSPVKITATVTATAPGAGTPTGTVTFWEGAVLLGSSALSAGSASITTSSLAVGAHSITAVYAGDANFNLSNAPALAQAITPDAVTVALASTLNPSTYGNDVVFNVAVASVSTGGIPTGTVTIYDGATSMKSGALDGSGKASLTVSGLLGGNRSLTASYSGDTNHNSGTSPAVAQLVRIPGTTTVASDANPSVFGQTVTLTAHVATVSSVVPTGTVTFKDGVATLGTGALDGSGNATFATSALGVGTHSITAAYAGDVVYIAGTSAAISQVVNKAASAAAVASTVNPQTVGGSVTFNATVTAAAPGSGTPTGLVTFFDGATLLSSVALSGGAASYATSSLTVGSHSITAVYAGDANFGVSNSPAVAQSITTDGVAVAIVSVQNPSGYGTDVVVQVAVTSASTGGVPTGTVTIYDGATSIKSGALDGAGKASFTLSALPGGSHSITAQYGGDPMHAAGTSVALAQVVDPATTSTVVASSVSPTVFGQSTTLTATVSSSAAGTLSGTVTFKADGTTVLGTVTLSAATATLALASLDVGTHPITATYSGDGNYATGISPAIDQVVGQAVTTTVVTSGTNPALLGASLTLTAKVSVTAPGVDTLAGDVTFYEGAASLGTGTLNGSGVANLAIASLAAGTHAITATYPGTAHLHASTSAELSQVVTANGASVALDSSANPSIAGGIVKLTATVTGTGATPTGSMTFSENGTTLSTVALDGSAKAALDMPSLTVGTHSIVATYGGDGLYPAGSTATLVQVVDKAATLTVVASSVNPSGPGQEVMLTATVTSSFAGVTGTVELFDGAVSLGTATLAGGQATLAVSSLTIGSHAITAGYSGDDAHVGSTSAVLTQNVSADAGVGDGGATDGGVDDAAGSDGALADVSAGDAAKSDAAVGDAAKADAPAIDGSARSDGGAGGNGGAGGAGGTSVVGDASALGDAPDAPEPGAALDVGESSGCGCRTASSRTSGVWLLGLAAVAAVVARRRRR